MICKLCGGTLNHIMFSVDYITNDSGHEVSCPANHSHMISSLEYCKMSTKEYAMHLIREKDVTIDILQHDIKLLEIIAENEEERNVTGITFSMTPLLKAQEWK